MYLMFLSDACVCVSNFEKAFLINLPGRLDKWNYCKILDFRFKKRSFFCQEEKRYFLESHHNLPGSLYFILFILIITKCKLYNIII